MSDVPPLVQFLVRGGAGAIVILLVTFLSDRYGAKSGGLLSAFPTITAVSLIVIGLEHDSAFAAQSALSTFFGLVAALVFVLGYYVGYRYVEGSRRTRTAAAAAAGFGLYGLFVVPYLLGVDEAGAANAVLLVVGYVLTRGVVRPEGTFEDAGDETKPLSEYTTKALFGGVIVVLATALADLFGPIFGGVFAAFPGTVAPILVIVSLTREAEFVYELASFMPAALLATGGFVFGVMVGFPAFGVLGGTLFAYLCYAVSLLGLSRFEDWARERLLEVDASTGV